jgi:hypothetical protein
MPKYLKLKADKHLRMGAALAALQVNPESGQLSNVLLMASSREAKGHGLWLDARSLQTALDAVTARGGQLKAYYTHDHRGAASGWMANIIEESASELNIPGYFDAIRIENEQLVAGTFTFYDSFRNANPAIVEQLLEMAQKTPNLLAQSVEVWGYAVYVDADGNEYQQRPEDTELQYDGMPALRVTDIFASAFVADGAATDGLFAKLSNKVTGRPLKGELVTLLRDALAAYQATLPPETHKTDNESPTNTPTDMNIIEQIKARFGADKARMLRALELHANKPTLNIDEITATLREEDTEIELARLRAEAADVERLRTENQNLTGRLSQIQAGGFNPDAQISLGTAAEGGAAPPSSQYTGFTARAAQDAAAVGRRFAVTVVSDLWTPSIWRQGLPEMVTRQTDLMTSPVVISGLPLLNEIASGGGTSGNVPHLREPDHADEPQVQDAAPTINNVASGLQICPILNRVSAIGQTALAVAVSGSNPDPIGYAMGVAARLRLRQRQTTLINILRGAFGTGSGALNDNRLASFVEVVGNQTSDHYLDSDMFFDAAAKLGEAKTRLEFGGVIFMHSVIEAALSKQDQIDYIKNSEGKIVMRMYKGLQVVLNDALVRAGSTSGNVYDTYIMTPGSIAMGDKPQSNQVGDAASLLTDGDVAKNNLTIYDRTRFILHPFGIRWTGTPSNVPGGASNAELATQGNWALAYAEAKRCGIVQLVTNG